jgi:hypothetical protein
VYPSTVVAPKQLGGAGATTVLGYTTILYTIR